MLIPSLLALVPVSADAGDGSLTQFSGGLSATTVQLNATGYVTTASIDSPRNITYQSATFEVSYNDDDPSPGRIWFDINEDGSEEWAWNGTGMGGLGLQTEFSNGGINESINVSSGTSTSLGFHLPSSAQTSSSLMNASFIPTLGGGLYSIGEVMALELADIDADGDMEIIILSNQPNGNSSANLSIGWMDWDSTNSNMSNISWVETCANGNDLRIGDVNNDSMADIGVTNFDDSSICIHLSDVNRVGYNSTFDNVSLPVAPLDMEFADIDGDNYDDVISIHGTGDLVLRQYLNSTATWGDNKTKLIESNTSVGMPAQLSDITAGELNGTGTGWTAIVSDTEDFVSTYKWDFANGIWTDKISSFDGIMSGMMIHDINGDGFLDIFGTTDLGHTVSMYDGLAWNVSSGMLLNSINATIADADMDGNMDLITPIVGAIDGSDSTFVGQLEVRSLNSSGAGNISSTSFTPVTGPTDVRVVDLDGDGRVEHIIAGGESNPGIFIAGWHYFSIDVDQDGTPEGTVTGYSGDGLAGLGPLEWSDMSNEVKDAIDILQPNAIMAQDFWHNEYFTITTDVDAGGDGIVFFENLNLTYDVSFMVNYNPYASANLSNSLNQQMQAGTGFFSITLPFNSTLPGVITIKDLAAPYIAGAPFLELPPTPVVSLMNVDESIVEFSWQNSTTFGQSFLNFQVFRVVSGTELDFAIHEISNNQLNMTTDSNIIPGVTYDYYVHSVHEYGVTSNLSDVLTVLVPFPGLIAQVDATVIDKPNDEGGWLNITWSNPVDSAGIDHFDIYVSTSEFSSVSGMTPVVDVNQSNLTVEVNISSEGEIVDGTQYWAASVAVDVYNRYQMDVNSDGPVMSRNDSQLSSEISVYLTSTDEHLDGSIPLTISRGMPLEVIVNLSNVGTPLPNSALILEMTSENSDWKRTYEGNSGADGTWTAIVTDDFNDVINSNHVAEGITILVSYVGFSGNETNQPISASVQSASLDVEVHASFVITSTDLRVDEDGEFTVSASLVSDWPADQVAVSEAVGLDYETFNESILQSGNTSFPGGSSITSITLASLPDGGDVTLSLTGIPDWLIVDSQDESISVEPALPEEPEGNNTIDDPPVELINPTITCEPVSLPMKDPGEAISSKCSIDNPNDFQVDINWRSSANWMGSTSLSVTMQPGSLEDIAKYGDADFDLRFAWTGDVSDLEIGENEFTLIADLLYGAETLQLNHTLTWQLVDQDDGQELEIPNPEDNNSGGDDNTTLEDNTSAGGDSQFLTYALYAAGGIIGLGVVVVIGSMVLGGKSDLEDDDDDDDSFYDDDKPTGSKALSRANRPDAVKFQERRNKPEPEPEPEPVVEEYYTDDEYNQQASGEWAAADDDGVTVDEDGTEWWEDDDQVWWYRTPEMEDWALFEE